MAAAKAGDRVKVHYTGKLEDGTVFDSSKMREPLEFTLGEGQVIPGFEEGIVGMNPSDEKTVEVPVDKGYGPRVESLVFQMQRTELPEDLSPNIGDQFEISDEDGQVFIGTVVESADEHVTFDANHPLAGKDLTFEIELVEVT